MVDGVQRKHHTHTQAAQKGGAASHIRNNSGENTQNSGETKGTKDAGGAKKAGGFCCDGKSCGGPACSRANVGKSTSNQFAASQAIQKKKEKSASV